MLDQIKDLKPLETAWDVGDKASIKGLHIKVTSDGRKMFYLYYRTKWGKQRRPKLGELGPAMTVNEARKLARSLLEKVSFGDDPQGKWEEKKSELCIGDLYKKCWEAYWGTTRFENSERGSGWSRHVNQLWTNHIEPSLGNLRLSETTPSVIRDWHQRLINTPTTANRALSVLSKLFHYAEERELRPQNTNPCRLVKKFKERSRKRYATTEEIQTIARLLEEEIDVHPAGVAFLYILMFSGSRPRAIERATWDQLKEFEIEGKPYGILTFSGKTTEKTGDEEKVVLPPLAMEAIQRLPRVKGYTITGIKMPRRLWRRVKEKAGCDDLWARDWRRTFATVGMTSGVDIGTIGELLNHRSTETTKIYAKVMEGHKFNAANKIANAMAELMKEKVG